ncbi:MAG: phage integrase SAM-like domain-containing protein [Bacteroidetes bacterium]|nr:phage integrase SAM-like domain-containing protein [Bacteroidota bacterium]
MANINPYFRLKNPKFEKPTLIFLVANSNYQKLIYSTGESILTEYWDQKNQRVKQVKDDMAKNQSHKEINKTLTRYLSKTDEILTDFKKLGISPTFEEVRKELDKEFKKNIQTKIDFVSFIETLIKESENGERLTIKGKRISPYTIKGYYTTQNHLKEYHTTTKNPIDFRFIDQKFYVQFVKYFQSNKKSTNTIGKNIKNIKVFMHEALIRGLTDNRQFQEKEFRKPSEDTDQIYLNFDELDKIHKLDLQSKPRLDRVRDIFLIGCYTGLRFSDLAQLRPINIIKDGTQLKVQTQKTDEIVVIPLHPIVKEILTKYIGIPPRVISNQKFNVYLKEIGELAGINDQVEVSITKGGMTVKTTPRKYELITVHTSRRSFATNGFLMNIPTLAIMKITGHRTEKAFLTYIRVSAEENADKLMEHPFFQAHSNLKAI